MLTENTKNTFLCIELVDKNRTEDFENVLKTLAKTVKDNFGGECKVSIFDTNNKEVTIE
jgi:DNA/RNA-binding domain of Phe-tRNA-synthetase-like protein